MQKYIIWTLLILSNAAFAENKITVSIDDLYNIDRGHSLEACGTAKHADGKKPLMVTLTHDQSKYTVLTDENGKWCTVFKRWNFKGTVNAVAMTLDFSEKSEPFIK